MFKQLSYRKKNRILLVGSLLSILLIYELAIKKTIIAYANCKQMEVQLQTANDAPKMMNELRRKNAKMDLLLGNEGKYADIQQSILGVVTDYCNANNLVLEQFPTPSVENNNGITIETNIITIEGEFGQLLNLIYLFEQKYKIGKVVSVNYKVKQDNLTRQIKLNVTIYLQNINKNGHET